MSDASFQPFRHKLLDHYGFAWFMFVIMLIVTLVLWQVFEHQSERRSKDRFLYLANKEGAAIVNRMGAYEQVLRGGVALFEASTHVSRDEWRSYVESLEIARTLQGIRGIGFAVVVKPSERESHTQQVQSAGFPNYRVSSSGEHDLLTSIIYLEPFDRRNRRAFGYDMYSEPVRRKAMAQARDTGEPTLSSKVILLQETSTNVQAGFLMYLPVYFNDSTPNDINSRRNALQGFVYSPFRANDLMNGVFKASGRELELELFDGEPSVNNLLYTTETKLLEAQYVTDIELQIAGRLWTARFHSNSVFDNRIANDRSLLILAAGIGLDLALFAMLLFNAKHRRGMRKVVGALEQSRDSYRTLVENVPGTVFRSQTKAPWKCDHISPGIEQLLGESPKRFINGEITLRNFIHPDDIDMVENTIEMAVAKSETYSVEYRIYTGNNDTRWVTERGRANYSPAGQSQWIDGVILDVTDRKVAELAIRDLAFYDPLTGLPNRRLLIDRLTHQIASTKRSKRFNALLFIDMDDFKSINDRMGHNAGDALLVEVAHRLLLSVREGDTVTRIGGDEFVLILVDLSEDQSEAVILAQQIGEKLINALNLPYQLEGKSQNNSCSIGITLFSGNEASVEELLRRADQAMYMAKSAGRNGMQFYKPKSIS